MSDSPEKPIPEKKEKPQEQPRDLEGVRWDVMQKLDADLAGEKLRDAEQVKVRSALSDSIVQFLKGHPEQLDPKIGVLIDRHLQRLGDQLGNPRFATRDAAHREFQKISTQFMQYIGVQNILARVKATERVSSPKDPTRETARRFGQVNEHLQNALTVVRDEWQSAEPLLAKLRHESDTARIDVILHAALESGKLPPRVLLTLHELSKNKSSVPQSLFTRDLLDTQQLLRILETDNTDEYLRSQAATRLAAKKVTEAVPALLRRFKAANFANVEILRALVSLDPKAAEPLVIETVKKTGDRFASRGATQLLARIGSEPCMRLLREIFDREKDAESRENIIGSLSSSPVPDVLPWLQREAVAPFQKETAFVKYTALSAVGRIARDKESPLRIDAAKMMKDFLTNPDEKVRAGAIYHIGADRSAESLATLGGILTKTTSKSDKVAVIATLQNFPFRDFYPILAHLVEAKDMDAELRLKALKVMAAYGFRDYEKDSPLGKAPDVFFLRLLGDADENVRAMAIEAVTRKKSVDAIPVLQKIVKEKRSGSERSRALQALGVIGHASVLPWLQEGLRTEKDNAVRQEYFSAIAHWIRSTDAKDTVMTIARTGETSQREIALGRLAEEANPAIEDMLMQELRDTKVLKYGNVALIGIGRIGTEKGFAFLSEMALQQKTPATRSYILEAISLARSPLAVRTLIAIGRKTGMEVVIPHLGGIGSPEAIDALIAINPQGIEEEIVKALRGNVSPKAIAYMREIILDGRQHADGATSEAYRNLQEIWRKLDEKVR